MALIGLEQVIANINAEIKKIEGRTLAGVLKAAELVRTAAMEKTPVVTGNLQKSAFVAWGKGIQNSNPKFKNPPDRPTRAAEMTQRHAQIIAQEQARHFTDNCIVSVGFSAIYAWAVHENPRAGKTGGYGPAKVKLGSGGISFSASQYRPGKTKSGRRSTAQVYSTVGEWKFLQKALQENAGRIYELIRRMAQVP